MPQYSAVGYGRQRHDAKTTDQISLRGGGAFSGGLIRDTSAIVPFFHQMRHELPNTALDSSARWKGGERRRHEKVASSDMGHDRVIGYQISMIAIVFVFRFCTCCSNQAPRVDNPSPFPDSAGPSPAPGVHATATRDLFFLL